MKTRTYRQVRRARAARNAGAPKWSALAAECGLSVGMAHMLVFGRRHHTRRTVRQYGVLLSIIARDGLPPVRARRGGVKLLEAA